MSTQPDATMNTAMAAFADLDPVDETPLAQDELDDDGANEAVDEGDEGEDTEQASGDEPEETDEQEDEPAAPAIDPPARWSEEQRRVWSSIPQDAQQVIAASFRDQERAIGAKAEEAATVRKHYEAVTTEAAQIAQRNAQQLSEYARAYEPQRPDFGLIATDPQAYAQQVAMYEAQIAQRDELSQRAQHAQREAEAIQQHQQREEQRVFHETLSQAWGDKWATPEARKAVLDELSPIASELGYADDVKSEANATDLLALRRAADWKAKADKWDQLQAGKMENVRAAKLKPRVQTPGTAAPRGSAKAEGLNMSMNRLRQTGDVRDAAAAFGKLG